MKEVQLIVIVVITVSIQHSLLLAKVIKNLIGIGIDFYKVTETSTLNLLH